MSCCSLGIIFSMVGPSVCFEVVVVTISVCPGVVVVVVVDLVVVDVVDVRESGGNVLGSAKNK